MTTAPKKAGRPTSTSREAILQAAMELLAEGGESSLSFRKLADKLGLSAPSIYTYFANKQMLLVSLAGCALALPTPVADNNEPPARQLAALLNTLRNNLLEKRYLLFLFSTALPAEAMLEVVETLASVIERAGIEHGQALRHAQSLMWMTLGFTIFEGNSQRPDVIEEFHPPRSDRFADTLAHLDIDSHDRLWQLTLERNLLFLDEK